MKQDIYKEVTDKIISNLRDAALRIDVESLGVHKVNAVQIDTNSHSVRRHRFEKRDCGH